jgi:hypothetical protein
MNNLIVDYLQNKKGSKKKDVAESGNTLKELKIPKDYKSLKMYELL